jgi:hypothetical protein
LVPEHLRLGTWDLLCGWTRQPSYRIEPRLALQLVHEAALCLRGLRERRCITLRGFEMLNGLPFLATDTAVHHLLDGHTVAEARQLQVALGKIRRVSGDYVEKLLLIDPHRPCSYTRRHVRLRQMNEGSKATKTVQMFFCLDGDTQQPLCCTIGTSARTVNQATPDLLELATRILDPITPGILVAADNEHLAVELIDHVHRNTPFDLIMPMPNRRNVQQRLRAMTAEQFKPRWAGYATAVVPYAPHHSQAGPYYELVQRQGERPDQWHFNSFFSTTDRHPVDALTRDYPKRWHVEEFFNTHQALGWQHAGTMNLNIRYGQMTMALLAQAAIYQLRRRLGQPYQHWDAKHLANVLFRGLEGDIRVVHDTIVVTYYNAPNKNLLCRQYQDLPSRLAAENVNPRIPWLYDFKLDFRFK